MDKKVQVVKSVFPVDGNETLFGKRWGGEVVELSEDDINALLKEKIIAIDVNDEYVVFVKKKL